MSRVKRTTIEKVEVIGAKWAGSYTQGGNIFVWEKGNAVNSIFIDGKNLEDFKKVVLKLGEELN